MQADILSSNKGASVVIQRKKLAKMYKTEIGEDARASGKNVGLDAFCPL
jgi:hypothetical protein